MNLAGVRDYLKPVNDEMFLKVQVQHVERLIDRVKTLNRVVYDVNKAPPFDTIEVFPHKNTNAESKQRESTKISTTHGLNDMKIKNTVEEAHIFEARRAARKRDMIRLGKLCDQAIAGQLRVAAAVSTGVESQNRVEALVEAGVDLVVIDTAHGHSQGVIDQVVKTKKDFPNLEIIAGNIATAKAAIDLAKAGTDCVKVGIGPGSICTTRIVAGVGVPQISAISDIAEALKKTNVTVIADGGIRYSGDAAKAFAAGAHCIMLGSMLAGTEESPGEVELYQGRSYKAYRGMGSIGAMGQAHGSSDRYFQAELAAEKLVPEGIEGRVPYKGSIRPIIHQMVGGIRSSMGYTGCKNLNAMRTKVEFVQVTSAGMTESHVHDVSITKEAPNYHQ